MDTFDIVLHAQAAKRQDTTNLRVESVAKQQGEFTQQQADLTSRVESVAKQQADLTSRVESVAKQQGEFTDTLGVVAKQQGEFTDSLGAVAKQQGEFTQQQADLTLRVESVAKQQGEFTERLGAVAKQQDAKGKDGAVGPKPDHEWKGTRLRFEKPDGKWGKFVDIKGDPGKPGGSSSTPLFGSSHASDFDISSLAAASDAVPDEFVVRQGDSWVRASFAQIVQWLYSATQQGDSVTVNGSPVTVGAQLVTVNGNQMEHVSIPPTEVHKPHSFEYADALDRMAATGFAEADVKKLALQVSDTTYWVLTSVEPTWEPVSKTEMVADPLAYYILSKT